MSKFLKISLVLLLLSGLTQCQEKKYGPGLNFDLFKGTPAAALATAVESEDTAAIEDLVKKGVPIDYKEPKFGNTLLYLAVADDKELSTGKLLQEGSNPNARTHINSSPFLAACAYSSDIKNPSRVLLLLISHGADVNSTQENKTEGNANLTFETTGLRSLCIYGKLPEVKVLVEHGACIACYGGNDSSILSTAVLSGNLDIAKYLMMEKKAPIPDFVTTRKLPNGDERKMTITDLLNEAGFSSGSPNKDELKQEILDFLKNEGKK